MTGWELKDPMGALKDAGKSNVKVLNNFLAVYKLAVVNDDFSVLLIFRHFKSNLVGGEMRTLNAPPENDDVFFQKGLTIVQRSDEAVSSHNIYLPNKYHYQEIKINGITISIIAEEIKKTTNVTEINQLFIFDGYTQEKLDGIFFRLNNIYTAKSAKKTVIKNSKIKNAILGTLVYDEKYEWYHTDFTDDKDKFEICIAFSSEEELSKTITGAQKFLKEKYYKPLSEAMQRDMLLQKNKYWLEEGEMSLTQEQFSRVVRIESVIFHENFACTIYCEDGGLFGGHTIVIQVDTQGRYNGAELAG